MDDHVGITGDVTDAWNKERPELVETGEQRVGTERRVAIAILSAPSSRSEFI